MANKKTIALLGYSPTAQMMQANQMMPPSQAQTVPLLPYTPQQQPNYYPQPMPVYQQPHQFNPNVVAVAGLGLLVLGVYMYFSEPFSTLTSIFQKNPAKDENEAYAIFANRIYEAKGYFKDDASEMYTIATEIVQTNDKEMWAKIQNWFNRKYKVALSKYLDFLDGNQRNKFYAILSGTEQYNPQAAQAVQSTQSTVQQVKQATGMSKAPTTKAYNSPYTKGMYLVTKIQSNTNIRKSPLVQNTSVGSDSNWAVSIHNRSYLIGVATGNAVETTQYTSEGVSMKTRFVEFKIKMNAVQGQNISINSSYHSLFENNKAKIMGDGLLLWIAESNIKGGYKSWNEAKSNTENITKNKDILWYFEP